MESWRHGALPWYLTWGVVFEFLRVVTHARVLPDPWSAEAAWSYVDALRASPSLKFLVHTDRHAAVAGEVLAAHRDLAGNLMHDAHTAILMLEHGVRRIVTRDKAFGRFPFLEVIDPLEG